MSPRPVTAAQAIEAVRDLAALGSATRFVGIDGPGAAGKSTLAAALADAVPGVVVVAVDDFSGSGIAEWDWARFRVQVVQPLRAGRDARYQHRSWNGERDGQWAAVPCGSIVVVEGVSATRSEVGLDWALRIWVDAPAEERRRRAIERDGAERWPRWRDQWIPSEERYIAAQDPRSRADLEVTGG